MINWPQLPEAIADSLFSEISSSKVLESKSRHPNQVYSPVGGRVSDGAIDHLVSELAELAAHFGYPSTASDSSRVSFDRAAAQLLRQHLDVSWAEAGNRRMWSFLALVPLPHLTYWRFGLGNRERWIASDLTRHAWARLWWQAIVFEGHDDLLSELTESDLNQILERRVIGGDPRLARALAHAVLKCDGTSHRALIRDSAKRLRRMLAFVDVRALPDAQIATFCQRIVSDSAQATKEPN